MSTPTSTAVPLTLMAVHAHPDDEATSTGGVLARYAAEGVRTVLVTCTDGSCGDGPGGVKPGDPAHHPDEVVAMRDAELRRSCEVLGVSDLELLGYRDSGMMGWPSNEAPGAFWGMDVRTAAAPLVELMQRYRPQVVVTYDANGFYGHPDHIMAHRIATAAVASSGVASKLYHTTVARSGLAEMAAAMRDAGMEPPSPSDREEGRYAAPEDPAAEDGGPSFDDLGVPDEEVTTRVDVAAYTAAKRAALAAHASQSDNIFFLRLPEGLFDRFFGTESFVRAWDLTAAPLPEDDLFAGLR